MSAVATISVGIVEDNAAVGASLQSIVECSQGLRFVGLWRSGNDALEKIGKVKPQVILMDINLPDISGIEVTARVKQALPETQVIMMTVFCDHETIFAALRAGASGYLLKRSSAAEIRDALAGGAPMSPEIAHRVIGAFHQPAVGSGEEFDLSRREIDVLEKLSEGFENKEIAIRLGIALDTVRVHLRNVYKKLHVRTRTQAVLKFRKAVDARGPLRL